MKNNAKNNLHVLGFRIAIDQVIKIGTLPSSAVKEKLLLPNKVLTSIICVSLVFKVLGETSLGWRAPIDTLAISFFLLSNLANGISQIRFRLQLKFAWRSTSKKVSHKIIPPAPHHIVRKLAIAMPCYSEK